MSDDPTPAGGDPPAPDDQVDAGGDDDGPDDAPDAVDDVDEGADARDGRRDAADDGDDAPGVAPDGEDDAGNDAPGVAPEGEDGPRDGGDEAPDEADGDGEQAADAEGDAEGEEAADDEGHADGEGAGDAEGATDDDVTAEGADVPEDVRKYARFKKVDGAQYERVNDFLRERTYVTAREWAIARLCADFRTETGVEMTKIGENLDELVPFMEDTYSPQAVNQARSSFEEKVHKAGATFLYGAMSDFFTAEELDELMYEVTEVAKFLLEVEGVDLSVEDELEAEDRISGVMREVREASEQLRYEECPHCGEQLHE